MLFRSITAVLIFSIYLLISSSSDANQVTFLFLVLFALKTSNNLGIGFILIYSSFTSCLLISIWVHSKSTNTLSCSFFLFDVFIFVYTLSFLSLLSLFYRIKYWFFRELLCTEVCCTMPTLNLWQNPFSLLFSSLSSLSEYSCILLFFIFCPGLQFFS